jgi:hypothetical protein
MKKPIASRLCWWFIVFSCLTYNKKNLVRASLSPSATAITSHNKAHTHIVDLSYQTDQNVQRVLTAFDAEWVTVTAIHDDDKNSTDTETLLNKNATDDAADTNTAVNVDVTIDISHSWLGDEGVQHILDQVFCIGNANVTRTTTTEEQGNHQVPNTVHISLESRMNQVTQGGMTRLLEDLMKHYILQHEAEQKQLPSLQQQIPDAEIYNITRTICQNATLTSLNDETSILASLANEAVEAVSNETSTSAATTIIDNVTSLPITSESDEDTAATQDIMSKPHVYVHSLDFGLNNIGHATSSKSEHKLCRALRHLVQSPVACPRVLKLDRNQLSVAMCRAIGRGMINNSHANATKSHTQIGPDDRINKACIRELYLSGNADIGDAGCAALAAAVRLVNLNRRKQEKNKDDSIDVDGSDDLFVLDVLDLSSCNIGDAGTEALAMALETGALCIQHLDLSNNQISDRGVAAIAQALLKAKKNDRKNKSQTSSPLMACLDVSGNAGIGNQGAAAMAACVAAQCVSTLKIRSCSIQADGAAAMAKALIAMAGATVKERSIHVDVDLSGNAFGTNKVKKKKSGTSASALSAKATKTSRKYIGMFGKRLSSGLRDVAGVDISAFMGSSSTMESDDDMEDMMGIDGEQREAGSGNSIDADDDHEDSKLESEEHARHVASGGRCGARSFADPFVNVTSSDASNIIANTVESNLKCTIGLRKCSLDKRAFDALALTMLQARQRLGIDMKIDASMNDMGAAEDEIKPAVENLLTGTVDSEELQNAAKRYQMLMEVMQRARERAAEAVAAAAQRSQAESAFGSAWIDDEDEDNYDNHYQGDIFDDEGYDAYDDELDEDDGYDDY